ncbi:putative transcriptional regulatory protein [Tolypocladium ophioglossoides CBS 100239]|uniref:Putative transcriptional regulatory protein n=1 Tax=Tolypocladium ophioglossoides (strain CBS 100239) TaxID=1163406 RepID=A0A0L0NMS3_TOLOC|nr:putative transcriptional regulatory protein [Tolypocladium ophioglossoides CBS 100239]
MEETPMGESIKTSCERCRRRKEPHSSLQIKCDRKRPCSRCVKAGTECVLQGTGEKQRPVPKSYVQALEGQVASLEVVIRKLALANDEERDAILSGLPLSTAQADESRMDCTSSPSTPDHRLVAARLRAGQMRRPPDSRATQFFGGTSSFQIHFSREAPPPPVTDGPDASTAPMDDPIIASLPGSGADAEELSPRSGFFQYAPHDQTSQTLMATFFKEQYQYNMVVYREYFLRDYDVGSGRYYSDVLLYSICALGALQYDNSLNLSDVFSGQAQALLYSTLDSPDLTTLQALVLLGYREIAVGRTSKGWLFCGMAFRLAHEMGLHLDPSNWDGYTGCLRDREILRRVYWAVFIADKQLSLYFGRPPALYPSESDVRNTIRLQYPPDWQGLLETYICKMATASEYEDSVALVGSFIYRAELSKIIHVMITDLFENRRGDVDPAMAAAKSRKIHVSLTKWLSSLPGALHWNQWTVGQVPSSVLHLHMLFHTVMIILHRPPSNMFEKPGIAESEDVEICHESLQAILRLMRTYSRFYRYRSLPLDFVHTLSTVAGTVMMKRFLRGSSWDDPNIDRPLSLITEAMDDIRNTWPCVKEIRDCVARARQTQTTMPPEVPLHGGPDLMNGLEMDDDEVDAMTSFMAGLGDDPGTLVTDEYLSAQLQGGQSCLESFDFNQPPGMIDSRQAWTRLTSARATGIYSFGASRSS